MDDYSDYDAFDPGNMDPEVLEKIQKYQEKAHDTLKMAASNTKDPAERRKLLKMMLNTKIQKNQNIRSGQARYEERMERIKQSNKEKREKESSSSSEEDEEKDEKPKKKRILSEGQRKRRNQKKKEKKREKKKKLELDRELEEELKEELGELDESNNEMEKLKEDGVI